MCPPSLSSGAAPRFACGSLLYPYPTPPRCRGPMQGQANHFFRYAPEKIPYGIERYQVRSPSSAPSLLASPATNPPPPPHTRSSSSRPRHAGCIRSTRSTSRTRPRAAGSSAASIRTRTSSAGPGSAPARGPASTWPRSPSCRPGSTGSRRARPCRRACSYPTGRTRSRSCAGTRPWQRRRRARRPRGS